MQPIYLRLNIGARKRLDALRQLGNHSRKTWREARDYGYGNWRAAYCAGMNQARDSWYSHDSGAYFRNERDAHDIVNMRHEGWFTDTECDSKAIGIVARLPHGRFIAGYRWTDNGERIFFDSTYADEDDAARMADEHARVFADSAREDDERFMEMAKAEGHVETCEYDLRNALDARHSSDYWREHARDALANLREARDALTEATKAYERG